jgi:hypothetical protein
MYKHLKYWIASLHLRPTERQRDRERDVQAFEVLNCIFAPKTSQQKPTHGFVKDAECVGGIVNHKLASYKD